MSVKSCEKVEKSQVVLTIEVGAAEFEAAVEKAYQKMRRKINVPGFRPGKAPRKIIEGMYGAEVFYEEAINAAFPEAYEAAVKEQELQVVGYPTVELVGGTKGPVTLDADKNIVLLIKSNTTQSIKVVSTKDGSSVTKTYTLTGLTLEA